MMRVWCFLLCCCCWAPLALAESSTLEQHSSGVLQGFEGLHDGESRERHIATQSKHEILFWMGLSLLVLVLSTASLGIAMGVFGKEVYVAHMLSAGLSVTLAIVHAVVAMVWFWPYN